jgi:Fe-S-cluster-containing dehydrogenase component
MDPVDKVMKKCTLCVDRIYNENIPAEERLPACVNACPARARHFGDLADPESEVSRLVAERGGYDLMPELGYAPTNKYLPPRSGTAAARPAGATEALMPAAPAGGFLAWLDRVLAD